MDTISATPARCEQRGSFPCGVPLRQLPGNRRRHPGRWSHELQHRFVCLICMFTWSAVAKEHLFGVYGGRKGWGIPLQLGDRWCMVSTSKIIPICGHQRPAQVRIRSSCQRNEYSCGLTGLNGLYLHRYVYLLVGYIACASFLGNHHVVACLAQGGSTTYSSPTAPRPCRPYHHAQPPLRQLTPLPFPPQLPPLFPFSPRNRLLIHPPYTLRTRQP